MTEPNNRAQELRRGICYLSDALAAARRTAAKAQREATDLDAAITKARAELALIEEEASHSAHLSRGSKEQNK